MAKAVYTLDKVMAKIAGPAEFAQGATVDYTFAIGAYGMYYGATSNLTATQQAYVRDAMTAWDDVSNLNFAYTSSASTADIKMYNVAYGGFAGGQIADEIMISSAYSPTMNPVTGGYGPMVFIHEIGHALGLNHPGNYNGGSPTYARNALFYQDSQQYTVMSYFAASNTGANHGGYYAQTPLLYDIAALQKLYGADYTTRAGDTVYGFNATAGREAFDFATNLHPIVCVWDGGGNDTVDLSGYGMTQLIDLRAGNFSDIGGLTKNFSIAYNCAIENAVGGSGNDTMCGNDLANVLRGGAGNDVLVGYGGADTLAGGTGDDTYYVDSTDTLSEATGAGTDTVYAAFTFTLADNFENLVLTGRAALNGTGNALNNTLVGNEAANVLDGGLGNDTMMGGRGNDTYVVNSIYDVVSEVRGQGTDLVYASSSFALSAEVENLTLTGVGATNGTGNALANVLTGNDAANVLRGGAGNDKLYGGAGDDVLYGEAGVDMLWGGTGADRFCFDATSTGRDIIKDFKVSEGDTLDVQSLLVGFDASAFDSFVQVTRSGVSSVLMVDRDGAGASYRLTQYALIEQVSGLSAQSLFASHFLIA